MAVRRISSYNLRKVIVGLPVLLFVAIGVSAQGTVPGDEVMLLHELLPKELEGWSVTGDDRIYSRNSIFKYMDGAGEIYRTYDFRRLLVRQYSKKSAPPIVAEIYQMSSSRDAYGIFSHDKDGQEVAVGQEGIYAMGLLRFWKGHIFVRLFAESETDETKAAVMTMGRRVADAIPHGGEKPILVACLPLQWLVRQSIHFFHTQVSLNCHYYLAESNVLNLGENTDAVLARYEKEGDKARLLLVRYRKPEEAKTAYEQFIRIYFTKKPIGRSPMRVEKIGNNEFVSTRWIESCIILVFEAADEKTCRWLTEAVTKTLREVFQWGRKAKR